ncbi:MAG: hypothetical protein JNK45_33725, partial [Myxococcales bacterium]|nr:hypothetical protein [Myxococcales bacterium]
MRPRLIVTAFVVPSLVLACGGGDSVSGTSFTTDAPPTTTDAGSTSGAVDSSSGGSGSASAEGDTSTGGADTTSAPADTSGDGSSGETGTVECTEQVDEPDADGLDENGDGVDGVACGAVFVSADGGSDLNDGLTSDDPVQTISHAIELASASNPPRMVLVAAGTYVETVNLASGVSVYGGYDPASWGRNTENNVTTIQGTEPRTIIAQNLDLFTEFDGFTVEGLDYASGGQSTYGVWVRDTPENLLRLDWLTVVAGDAGDGADGDDGAQGDNGGNGTNGSGQFGGDGGTSTCGAVGGPGGDGMSCPATDGDDGSAGGAPTVVGAGGPAGASQCNSSCNDSGADGTDGNDGNVGINGGGAETAVDNLGTFGGDGLWTPPAGDEATSGNNGSGGGGGGSGGHDSDDAVSCCFGPFAGDGFGGGGGGGGAGGCGGEAGETGQPG